MNLKEVNDNFIKGKPVSDNELDVLLVFYLDLEKSIDIFDDKFFFFKSEIRRLRIQLQGYYQSRHC